MHILAVADIHGTYEQLSRIIASAKAETEKLDLVLAAGDLTEFGGKAELDMVLESFGVLRKLLVAVPGNCDKRSARERLESLGFSADGHLVERGGAKLVGVGGSALRSGLTPYERHEEELRAELSGAFDELNHGSDGEGPAIVLSHQPPKDSGADMRRGASVGSKSLREILDLQKPALWVCGHIHEAFGAFRVGRSLVVNPGPASAGYFALIRLEPVPKGLWKAEASLRSPPAG
jgi:Icc-related predicted phosphoesterase